MAEWRVRDQVIIVTGASKGIGLSCATALLDRGAKVALLARDLAKLQQAKESLARYQDHCAVFPADACRKSDLETAFQAIAAQWGKIDGIVNNVGFQFARRLELMPEEEIRRMVDLNFLSAIFGCQAVIPHLRKNGGGRIVNISSAAVRHDNEFAHLGLYVSSKAALDRFTVELRHELTPDRIMVTLFSPGAVATGSVANFDSAALADALLAWKERGQYAPGMIMDDRTMGEAIAHCFEYPPDVAVEFMEVRPNMRMPKKLENE